MHNLLSCTFPDTSVVYSLYGKVLAGSALRCFQTNDLMSDEQGFCDCTRRYGVPGNENEECIFVC